MTFIAVIIGMMQNKVKIAVTGGIGSGKSTVCNFIKQLGYPVFSCDRVYAELLRSGKLTGRLVDEFGVNILLDGKIDKSKLSECVFDDKEKLLKLNEITHTEIFKEMFLQSEKFQGAVFYEVPLLFEGNYQNLFDEIIVVLRAVNERFLSVKFRDNLSDEEIKKRIKSQYNYDINNFAQYYVIHNNSKIDDLCDKINSILLKITQKYKL